MVPHSGSVTVSNRNSRSADFTEDTIKNLLEQHLFLLLLDNLAVVLERFNSVG
jgi:hypothetical protein